MKFDIANVTRALHRTGARINNKSPEILIAVGIIGGIASCVMACKATLKVNEELEQPKEDLDKIRKAAEEGVTEAGLEYSVEDSKKDIRIVYTQTAVKVVKAYAPAIIVGGLSIFAIVKSHHLMATRYAGVVASFKALEKEYKGYRNRVIERFGPELDRELRYDVQTVETKKTVTNPDGTTEEVTELVDEVNAGSIYSFVFDELCYQWTKDPITNRITLEHVESMFTDKLRAQGHLVLNEVRKYFHLDPIAIGYQAGWIYDESNPDSDNYVSFNIWNPNIKQNKDCINARDRYFIVEPNCEGYILDRL